MRSEDGDFLLIDKPLEWTSFDVVARIRNTYKRAGLARKVGHCGTLDPRATGLLILATGKKTKQISSIEVQEKEYIGTIKLGAKTPSYDSETEEYDIQDASHLTENDIRQAAESFLGKQLQLPPMYSASWHMGERLYKLARQGKDAPDRPMKPIEIFEFELSRIALPEVAFRIRVSKGTYIRTVAQELGEKLGVGGYLVALRRTKIGDYRIEDAFAVSDAVEKIEVDREEKVK
ncbi:MAG: tRNA pseudouridine(55) synthase TruB [Chlorobiales bacterium]|jgi:tRNA pseudouridine55 synthase|nr:tRNA pseudouridine(55) synthase TruB [Chlorobiales bacterium]